ncbi:3-oxoadipate enol-lactonase [Stackebrandtia endophytica]|uniref:3-oxoadipate enol-lactonase n=1 Tax=Stackebrandtia endophytica TaxID=1496996 RepID=A0A543AXB5_9ACTN|nr:alpha/beta hydrolase [Stackebrandtia endophytica]TQL77224.1 3-oxoadipate enol-lactonase [Stackebrandtia endophytica]
MARKPTVVFLHAMGGSHRMWDAQVEALATDYNIVAPDLPGHGLNKTRFTMEAAADQALRAIRINSAGPVHLVGASLGASVALHVALAAPARVAGMILSGTMIQVPHGALRAQRIVTSLFPVRALAIASARAVAAARPQDRDALMTDIVQAGRRTQLDALRALRTDDIGERLGRLTVPTLVCCGARDQLNLPSVDILVEAIPHATKKIIPDADHLWNLQRPKQFTQLIRDQVESTNQPK